MNAARPVPGARRIYLCRCGQVHVETEHARLTLSPEALRDALRGCVDRVMEPFRPPSDPGARGARRASDPGP